MNCFSMRLKGSPRWDEDRFVTRDLLQFVILNPGCVYVTTAYHTNTHFGWVYTIDPCNHG